MTSRFGLELRSASAADAAGLAELMRASGLQPDPASLGDRIDAIRVEHGAVLVAVEWGPPSGVIALGWRWSLQEPARRADVSLLLVAPEARRRGIGRLLIKAAAQSARSAGCGDLQIRVTEEMADVRAFALATGFADGGATLRRPLKKR